MLGHVCIVEQAQVDRLAGIDQRGEAGELASAAAELHLLWEIAEVPVGQPGALEGIGLAAAAVGDARRTAQLLAQRRQVAAAGKFLAAVVDHAEVHREMRRQLALPLVGMHVGTGLAADECGKRLGQQALAGLRDGKEGGDGVGQRDQRAALVLGQELQECRQFLADESRHQPVDLGRLDAVEQVERQPQRHAVERMPGLEAVLELARHAVDDERLGEQGVVGADPLADDVLARQEQGPRIRRFGLAPPLLERGAVVDAGGNARVEHAEDALLVQPHPGLAGLVLERFDLLDQRAVVRVPFGLGVVLARHQRAADEELARELGVDRPVVDLAPRHQGDAVETHALEGDDARAVLLPVRLEIHARQQVPAGRLDPLRPHFGDGAREQPPGVRQFGGDDPLRPLLRQCRTGMDRQLDAARALVVALARSIRATPLLLLPRGKRRGEGAEADVAQQAREHCLVDGVVAGVLVVLAQAELGELGVQLAVDVAPFAHAPRRQEVVLQQGLQLAVALLVLQLLVVPLPQLEPAHEVGALVGEELVLLVGGLRALHRAVARVLHRQRAGDDQHLAHAALLLRGQQHPRDARVERQLGELPADLGQFALIVERMEFGEELVAVGDEPVAGRIDEGEAHHVAEPERLHPEDDARERRAQQFGVGEARPVGEVVLVIEADADAVGDTAAAAGALVGRRLADLLDQELLDLVARRIALDPGGAGVDDIADARHGERGLGDVGRQHDAAQGGGRLEDRVLLGDRKAREQRQDFGAGRMVLAQRLGGVADLALAGQEDEDVARTFERQFVGGVEDGANQIALGITFAPSPSGGELGRGREAIALGITSAPLDRLGHHVCSLPLGGRVGERARSNRLGPGLRPLSPDPSPACGRGEDAALAAFDGPPADLHRVQAAGHLDHRGAAEVLREALGVDGRRGDHDAQVGALLEQRLQVAEQEVDVEAALVRLVDEDGVVARQQRIALALGEQDAVGHHLDRGVAPNLVGEAHLVTDQAAEFAAEFLRNARGDRARGDAARLGAADHPAWPRCARFEQDLQAHLGNLRGLAGTRLAAQDQHPVRLERGEDVFAPGADGKVGIGNLQSCYSDSKTGFSAKYAKKREDRHRLRHSPSKGKITRNGNLRLRAYS